MTPERERGTYVVGGQGEESCDQPAAVIGVLLKTSFSFCFLWVLGFSHAHIVVQVVVVVCPVDAFPVPMLANMTFQY